MVLGADTTVSVVLAVIGLALAIVGGLVAFIAHGIRGDVKETKGDVKGLHAKLDSEIQDVYGWADERFMTKELCRAKHESGRQPTVGS